MTNKPIRKSRKQPKPKRQAAQPKAVKRLAQLERELRVNEERWQAVMNNPIMGVTVLGPDHRFIMANPTFQAMVGYTDAELKKLTAIDITPSDQRDLNSRLFKELQEGKRNNYELIKQLQRKDGKLIWIQLHVFGISNRTSSVGQHTFGMIFDITEKMQAQDALQVAQAKLAQSAQSSRMGAMTASIAHEIKQPLAAIMTNANAGLRWIGQTPPNVAETRMALERIVDESQRTDDVVQNIRAMFKSDASSRTSVDMNELINEVLTLAKGDLQRRAIIVHTILDNNLPPVMANRVQLQQVLFNLVTNAIEAMEPVGERDRQLLIKSEPGTEGEVSLAVEDSGTGIDPKHIERVFSSFFTTKDKGMGMGLSICRSIIESHGGRLWASRGSRHGSVFQFTLPVKAEDMTTSQMG
jgi:PAS domain S-box-containing protein